MYKDQNVKFDFKCQMFDLFYFSMFSWENQKLYWVRDLRGNKESSLFDDWSDLIPR